MSGAAIAGVTLLGALLFGGGAQAAALLEIRDSEGRPVANAVIEVGQGMEAAPAEGAVIDQVDKRFVPFVSAIPVGTRVRFPNSDNTRHHVYSFSDAKTFELKLYRANDAEPVLFDRPGLVTLGCNVHDNMKAYVLVSDASFRAVSNTAGEVEAPPGIEAGPRLRVWHPALSQPVETLATRVDGAWRVALDVAIENIDEQSPRSESLEERLKRFKRDAR